MTGRRTTKRTGVALSEPRFVRATRAPSRDTNTTKRRQRHPYDAGTPRRCVPTSASDDDQRSVNAGARTIALREDRQAARHVPECDAAARAPGR
jgi:hypothetical protein